MRYIRNYHDLFAKSFGWRRTGHRTLPKQPLLLFILLVLGQLPCNGMHYTSVVEDDDVTFYPSVGVYVLYCIYPLLESVHDLANLFDIIDDRNLSSFGIFRCQLEDTAAVDL